MCHLFLTLPEQEEIQTAPLQWPFPNSLGGNFLFILLLLFQAAAFLPPLASLLQPGTVQMIILLQFLL